MRLEQAEEYTFNVIEPHFNSIKVRLKLNAESNTIKTPLFQFHKGTIKTGGGDALQGGERISIP